MALYALSLNSGVAGVVPALISLSGRADVGSEVVGSEVVGKSVDAGVNIGVGDGVGMGVDGGGGVGIGGLEQ